MISLLFCFVSDHALSRDDCADHHKAEIISAATYREYTKPKRDCQQRQSLLYVSPEGLEPSTHWLRVSCSTNWARETTKTLLFSKAGAKVRLFFGLCKSNHHFSLLFYIFRTLEKSPSAPTSVVAVFFLPQMELFGHIQNGILIRLR